MERRDPSYIDAYQRMCSKVGLPGRSARRLRGESHALLAFLGDPPAGRGLA